MNEKICRKCSESKELDSFPFRNKLLLKRHSTCKECHNKVIRKHYKDNTPYYIAKAKKRKLEYGDPVRNEIVRIKESNPCADCGNFFPYYVMDFDHLKNKEHNVSQITSLDVLAQEIAKCEIVCSNCHRTRTHDRYIRL